MNVTQARSALSRMSETELCALVSVDYGNYEDEAIELAWTELNRREVGQLSRAEVDGSARLARRGLWAWWHVGACGAGIGLGSVAHWVIGAVLP